MQKSKPRAIHAALHFKANTKEIRARANMLPMKSMLYAISHALSDPAIKAETGAAARRRIGVLSRHHTSLSRMVLYLGNLSEINPSQQYGAIASAAHSYVNLFYSMNHRRVQDYVQRHSGSSISKRVKPENNLLLLPAISATKGTRRSTVHTTITRNLYAMPLRFLYDKTKSAMRLELFQQAVGVKSAKESALAGFSATMKNIEALLNGIGSGEINPQSDERAKEMFVNHISDISEAEEMGLSEYISEKLATNNVSFKIARRIIRK